MLKATQPVSGETKLGTRLSRLTPESTRSAHLTLMKGTYSRLQSHPQVLKTSAPRATGT